ncbi:helix-turn-helix transcriptional regulator [Nocardiopsis sp. CNT-189]|uniref:helix-turn-helix domain-containing protein n=1 Tax=Nocardiopsis oceanisediminis TaxID=2816862 RepID=UPI003B323E46
MSTRAPRWIWVRPEARAALASGEAGAMLACYRRLTGLSQAVLAQHLGYDPSYICLLERGRRRISDRAGLAHLSRRLGIPPHALGITADETDHAAALQFGDSTVRLADIARRSGRATEAAEELWPLTARLEALLAEGRVDAPMVGLLARARTALGVCLGHLLAEEQLHAAACWTGRALVLAEQLDEPELHAHVLRMHGNELRKAGRPAAAIARLSQALALPASRAEHGQALFLLARAAGEHDDADTFDAAIEAADRSIGEEPVGILLTPFTVREARIRGLACTGRLREAADLAARPAGASAPAPQWEAIEAATTGHVLLAAGDETGGAEALERGLSASVAHRLPHQIQRILRTARAANRDDLAFRAETALAALHRPPLPESPT